MWLKEKRKSSSPGPKRDENMFISYEQTALKQRIEQLRKFVAFRVPEYQNFSSKITESSSREK